MEPPWQTYLRSGALSSKRFHDQWYDRQPSMAVTLQRLADLRKGDRCLIVETAAASEDYPEFRQRWMTGQPTLLWARYVQTFGGRVVTIVPDAAAAEAVRRRMAPFPEVAVAVGDAVDTLAGLPGPIDLLYPNGAPFPWLTTAPGALDPAEAQRRTLAEVRAALPRLHNGSVVLLDECGAPFGGRCRLALEFLRASGWTAVHSGHQVALLLARRPPPCRSLACQLVPQWVDEAHPILLPWRAYFAAGALNRRTFFRAWYDREPTFRDALERLTAAAVGRGAGVGSTIFETGAVRRRHASDFRERWGDGQSTLLFSKYARMYGARVVSVDSDPHVVHEARPRLEPFGPNVTLLEGDSVAALAAFNGTLDLLYLDSHDFDWLVTPPTQFDPLPAQRHALNEVRAALPHLTARSVVLLDDCELPFGGKCRLAVKFLRANGWRVVRRWYQILLIAPSRPRRPHR